MEMVSMKFVAALTSIVVLCGCGTLARELAAPPPVSPVSVQDFGAEQIRFLPFENQSVIAKSIEQAYVGESPENYDIGPQGEHVYNYLAISGGGSDGAFGAGLLNGWSELGTRPRFKIVTGVSTGALSAPFAFLGSDYDDELKASYTTVSADRVFEFVGILKLLWSDAATSTQPLQDLIKTFVDEKLLDAIAIEHRKGRRLFVASTNLDAEQPVIWDLGAIADSGRPDRLALFRKVVLASASIPSIFPPVMIDVTKDGKEYQEMHVDGGVFFQSFFVGAAVDLPATIAAAHPEFSGKVNQNLYVIRNGWVTSSFQNVERGLVTIAGRAILTMFKVSGINDLWRLYVTTRDDQVKYHYIAIPEDYVPSTSEQFNQAEMNREYEFGRAMALEGVEWRSTPPGYAAPVD